MVEHLLCFRCKCLRVLHVSLYCTHTHTHLCVSMVPSSLSCHFTASQVSPKQTDASPPTSPLFAAHSIIGHTHTHTHANDMLNFEVCLIVNKNTVWQSQGHVFVHTHTQNAWPNCKPAGENDFHNCCWLTTPTPNTHRHRHAHTLTLTPFSTFLFNSIPFFPQSTMFYTGVNIERLLWHLCVVILIKWWALKYIKGNVTSFYLSTSWIELILVSYGFKCGADFDDVRDSLSSVGISKHNAA